MKKAFDVLYDEEKRKKYDSKHEAPRVTKSRKRQKASVISKAYAKNWPNRPPKTSKSALYELFQEFGLMLKRNDFEETGGPPWIICWRKFPQ